MLASPAARTALLQFATDGRAPDRAARRARPVPASSSIPKRSRFSTGSTRPTSRRISWAAACATCCSAASRRTSTSAPRRIPTRSRSSSATAGSSDGGSGWRTCASATRRSRWPRSAGRSRRRRRPRPSTPLQTLAPPDSDVAAPELDDARDRLMHRDNTFGTPEEDAFRRDFTINALFYDIATFSIIDYTGGLEDLRAGIVRCIGVPEERFQEDPVRMLRAVAMAARLGFTIDPPIEAAIAAHRSDIARSAPGAPDRGVLQAAAVGRGRARVPDAGRAQAARADLRGAAGARRRRALASLAAVDAYRNRFESAPDTLTNADPARLAAGAARARGQGGDEPAALDRRHEEGAAHLARAAAAGAARHRAPAADPGAAAAAGSTPRCRRARAARCCTRARSARR